MRTLHLLVEGPGDRQAAPLLLRRLLHEQHRRHDWLVEPKHVMEVGGLPKLRRRLPDFIGHLRGKACDGALILLDLDDQPGGQPLLPCQEGPALAAEIAALQPLPFPVVVVFAYREYEAWLLASLASITGRSPHFPRPLAYPGNPEGKRDAKGELDKRMPPLLKYKEVLHQAEFTRLLDVEQARQAPSFRRLERALSELLAAVDTGTGHGLVSPPCR